MTIRSIFAALVLAAALCVLPLRADVRAISDAERTAVQLAAAYLSGGPDALANELATTSPLHALPHAEKLAELEVRLGPATGAQWDLQTVVPALENRMAAFRVTWPGGVEDHLIFELAREGNAFKLHDVRFLAQERERKPFFAAASVAPTATTSNEWQPVDLLRPAVIVFGILAALLAGMSAFAAREHRAVSRVMVAFAILFAGGAAALLWNEDRLRAIGGDTKTAQASIIPTRDDGPPRLAPLLPLRRALTSGTGNVDEALRDIDRRQGRGFIADLWKIQADLTRLDMARVRSGLARFPAPSTRPLAELLRAQLAILERNEIEAAVSFEQAVNLGPGRDALWLDNAEILYSLGFEDRARGYYERLAKIGSRDADVYYSLAALAASDRKDEQAEEYLKKAWQMNPVDRATLIRAGIFATILRRRGMMEFISANTPAEPLVRSQLPPRTPLVLPPDAMPRTVGDLLEIKIGEQQLRVPGGASIAPPNTPVVEATVWAAEEQQKRLADLPMLLTIGTQASAYAQPALRERLIGTATALATHNRWGDLVRLTEGLSPASEHIPTEIFFLRSVALQRTQRDADATRLLAQVAKSPVLQRRRDTTLLMQLAELFAAHDLHDVAVRMYDRAQSIRAQDFVDDRVRQIQMNKRLETRYSTYDSTHFQIRYPDDVSRAAATKLGEVLEAELTRLKQWIPVGNFERVVVNVVWWEEFKSIYTGSDFILGFYNGKITVPFAGVPAEHPQIRNILAHELAHAMIAQASRDQAPRWFQEGFAQRIEQREYWDNGIRAYHETDLLVPVSLLDSLLSSPDPAMIGAAYSIAQTDIRFIESRYGRAGLQKMIAAYRDGATTEEAVRRLSGKPLEQFERELRDWGLKADGVFPGGQP